MSLPIDQVERFYKIWRSLLFFANDEMRVFPNLHGGGKKDDIDVTRAVEVRDELWKNEVVLDHFIKKNPTHLPVEDLRIAESWQYRRVGNFYIYKTLKKHAIFISSDNQADVFSVKWLYSSFEEMLGMDMPVMVETVLLPFEKTIIADGLIKPFMISFGSGIQSQLKAVYDDAKECEAIITMLPPTQNHLTMENLISKVDKINRKVSEAFTIFQYKSGKNTRIVDRDKSNVIRFSFFLKTSQLKPTSLREFTRNDLEKFLASVSDNEIKTVILSIKRFIVFLRDSDRLDWEDAEDMLALVK